MEEAEEWLVVNKPAPLIVHSTNNKPEPTLLDELRMSLERRGERSEGLSIINRLDRETSGLVLVARTSGAARTFGKAMMRRKITKAYRAIVSGWPDWEQQRVDEPILRLGETGASVIWLKQAVHPEGKAAVTHLEVERRLEGADGRFSVLKIQTETGRTHQIRVHCAHVGYPIVGDKIYGPDETCYLEYMESGWSDRLERILYLQRQALHADVLEVVWEGELKRWEAPMPSEMAEFISAAAGPPLLRG